MPNRVDLNPTWDLDSLFPGGSHSVAFKQFVDTLQTDVDAFQQQASALTPNVDQNTWVTFWTVAQDLDARVQQAGSFVGCLMAQNMKDGAAKLLEGRIKQLRAALTGALTTAEGALLHVQDSVFAALLATPELQGIAFSLTERRQQAKERMSTPSEVLVSDLGVNGYEAWEDLYYTVISRTSVPFEENGATIDLSVGQASNKMRSPNRAVRQAVFEKWEEAFADGAELFAHILNHLSGYRLSVYRHRGWDSVLKEPLEVNRMTAATLDTMWGVIEQNKDIFVDYLHRKARLLGQEKLSWSDVSAPIPGANSTYTYEEARAFIVEQFAKFNPRMAEFADHCFIHRWIEAEDRRGKRPGAFCTGFPVSQQSRVFATFSGTADNVSTLAHEIGHAYHGHVVRDLPQYAQNYAMNVAETASTFAETIVKDASVKGATSDAERIALLDDKVEQSVAMFMNIHARFLFETRFYERRRNGLLAVEEINELMEQAQRDAFRNALSVYHPHFWASKLHFYATDVPFYNFPYTFGYMFSTGIYARALEEGPAFADRYVQLLRDTGRMTAEDLARKHLDVDLTKPDFWQSAMDVAVGDAREFLRLTD